ncbi:MAG TPA: hypothetical protein GX707_20505 [Epulopiscium sp.]|nr:hypothetical protein [Candidatus Epulonipiscium sp.]
MDKQIFISASYYKQKYYANPKFEGLPVEIRNEMRDLCIMLAEKLHGVITLGFHLSGDVFFEIEAEEDDFDYDEIGSRLELKDIEEENKERFKTMKLWYLMYQTEYGDLFREILSLYHSQKKTSDEIIDILSSKYNQDMTDMVVEILESIQE